MLFSEELGAVIQVLHPDTDQVLKTLHDAGLGHSLPCYWNRERRSGH